MTSMKLVSVRHGDEHKSIIFYTGMRPAEASLLLSATFLSPHQQQQAALALSDPVTGQLISLDEACADANALPGLLDLCLQQHGSSDADGGSGQPAASLGSFSSPSSARPILHHQQHQHRVQPYPQHARQPSLQQQQQQLQAAAAAVAAPPLPASPASPLPSSGVPSFPPPFVLSLHSAADIEQALQLSDSLILLLFVHPPSSPASPAALQSGASPASSALSALYHQLASSSLYPHLLFLSIDQSLCPQHAAPSLHLYYAGSSIGQVLGVSEEQMMTLVASSEELLVALQGAETAAAEAGGGEEEEAQAQAAAEAEEEEKAAAAAVEQQAAELVLREGGVRWEEGEEEEGVLLSSDEAMALEALVLRSDAHVRAAYAAFPSLSLVVDAFMRIARHVGRQKEERRRRQAMAGSSGARGAATATADLRVSVYDQLLHSTLSALLQHRLMAPAEAEAVLGLYADRDPRVLRVLVLYQQSGKEEQLMEGLIAVGQQAAQARGGGAERAGGRGEEKDSRQGKVRTLGREWEGRDDSEGMRARKAAAAAEQPSTTRPSGGRSRWGTPARGHAAAAQRAQDEEEEEEEDEEEDDNEEEEDEQDEEDNGLQEEEEAAAEAGAQRRRPGSQLQARPGVNSSFSASSPLYTSAVNTLAALSSSQLISPSQLSLFVSLLTASHPLIVAAFVSYADTQDLPDLLDTLLRIHAAASGSVPSAAAASTAAAAQSAPSSASEAAGGADLTSLLSLLPAPFLSSHGRYISSLVAQRDRILLSALQIWREQERRGGAEAAGGRPAGGGAELQQLLAIIVKRVEKEKRTQAAADSKKSRLEAGNAAGSGALPATSAPFLRPASPQSPQVTREQVNELRSAYHTGLQQQQQAVGQGQQQQAEEKEDQTAEAAADSSRESVLQRALDSLQREGVLDAEQRGWVQSRYEQGDARVLAVLQVFGSTGDEAEMADSLRRIGQQFEPTRETASSQGSAAGQPQQQEEEEAKQQQQQQEPAVTVEDVTSEDKDQAVDERNGQQEPQQRPDERKEETAQ